MILKGSQRGGALKLAAHLSNDVENDHVELHELRGFSADDLRGALQETDALANGTKCQRFLFSPSLSPPETELVSVEDFETAIEQVEEKLGLKDQARAILFHEKEGRRHAHVVWSRINVAEMKAIKLPHYKTLLNAVSKELFLKHGWRLPEGFRDKSKRNPLNFPLDQWQQAKRTKQEPQALKIIFRECWSVSDNRASFEQALAEQGFVLVQGKRGHVAVDYQGEVYAVFRQTGQKAKAVREKLGDVKDLPFVDQAKDLIASRMSARLLAFIRDGEKQSAAREQDIRRRKQEVKGRQRAQRQVLKKKEEEQSQAETLARAKRFRTGIRGVWDWPSGKTRKVKRRNEIEAQDAARRDALERERMIAAQLSERRVLQQDLRKLRRETVRQSEELRRDVAYYLGLREHPSAGDEHRSQKKVRAVTHGPSPNR